MKQEDGLTPKPAKKKANPFAQLFWLTFLVASLGYAWYSFYAPSNGIKWVDNVTSVQELTEGANKNTLLFFTGKWCSPCRIMKREVFADQEVEKVVNAQVTAVIVDIDNPSTKELVAYYKVGATPTTIIVDAHGQVLDYAVGKVEKEQFLEMLRSSKP